MNSLFQKLLFFSALLISVIKSELLFVNYLFRHGSRGTIVKNTYDSDNTTEIAGELTPTGMRQHYGLGKMIREEYIEKLGFLDKKLNWNQIYVRCTDFNRTLQSAYSQLYSIYPPSEGETMNDLVDENDKLPPFKGAKKPTFLPSNVPLPNQYMPTPVHVDVKVIPYPPDYCKNYQQIKTQFYKVDKKSTLDEINKNYALTYKSYERLIDYDGELDFDNIEDVWDVLVSDLNAGYPMPAGVTTQLWKNLTELDTLHWFFLQEGSPQAVQLQNTYTFEQWMQNFDTALDKNSKSQLKMAIYSGHDNNVAGAMVGLGLTDYQCVLDKYWLGATTALNCNNRPYFAASVILELHMIDGQAQVAVKFDGKYQYVCGKKEIYCLYSEFKENVMKSQILTEKQINDMCTQAPSTSNFKTNFGFDSQKSQRQAFTLIWIILSTIVSLSVIVILAFKMKQTYLKSRKNNKNITQQPYTFVDTEQRI